MRVGQLTGQGQPVTYTGLWVGILPNFWDMAGPESSALRDIFSREAMSDKMSQPCFFLFPITDCNCFGVARLFLGYPAKMAVVPIGFPLQPQTCGTLRKRTPPHSTHFLDWREKSELFVCRSGG